MIDIEQETDLDNSNIQQASFSNKNLRADDVRNIVLLFPNLISLDLSQNFLELFPPGPPLYLTALNLSHNLLTKLNWFDRVYHLVELTVSHNKLQSTWGIATCTLLEYLDLSNNNIHSIDGLESLSKLNTLKLCNNNIRTFSSVRSLSFNTSLVSLDLTNNPITEITRYRGTIFNFVQSLQILDGISSGRHHKNRINHGYISRFEEIKNHEEQTHPLASVLYSKSPNRWKVRLSSPPKQSSQRLTNTTTTNSTQDTTSTQSIMISNKDINRNIAKEFENMTVSVESIPQEALQMTNFSNQHNNNSNTDLHVNMIQEPEDLEPNLPWRKPPDIVPRPLKGKDPYGYNDKNSKTNTTVVTQNPTVKSKKKPFYEFNRNKKQNLSTAVSADATRGGAVSNGHGYGPNESSRGWNRMLYQATDQSALEADEEDTLQYVGSLRGGSHGQSRYSFPNRSGSSGQSPSPESRRNAQTRRMSLSQRDRDKLKLDWSKSLRGSLDDRDYEPIRVSQISKSTARGPVTPGSKSGAIKTNEKLNNFNANSNDLTGNSTPFKYRITLGQQAPNSQQLGYNSAISKPSPSPEKTTVSPMTRKKLPAKIEKLIASRANVPVNPHSPKKEYYAAPPAFTQNSHVSRVTDMISIHRGSGYQLQRQLGTDDLHTSPTSTGSVRSVYQSSSRPVSPIKTPQLLSQPPPLPFDLKRLEGATSMPSVKARPGGHSQVPSSEVISPVESSRHERRGGGNIEVEQDIVDPRDDGQYQNQTNDFRNIPSSFDARENQDAFDPVDQDLIQSLIERKKETMKMLKRSREKYLQN